MRHLFLYSVLFGAVMLAGCEDTPDQARKNENAIADARDLSELDEVSDTKVVDIAANESDAATTQIPDGARTVDCNISSAQSADYEGPCLFLPDEGGSFALWLPGDEPILPNIVQVSVWITGEGQGDVRGLTVDGINSRWGEATRSTTDASCWKGSDFEICAR